MRSRCGVQVGAVISDSRGKIISWGWNYYKDTNGPLTVHAEEHAISRANPKRLRSGHITLTIFGQRNRSGNPVYSRPCVDRCLKLATKYGIQTLEYSTKEGSWETLNLKYI